MADDQEVKAKYKYLVIADEDTVLGFQLSGIPGIAVGNRADALAALKRAQDEKAGIVIVTEEVAAMMQEEVDELRFGGGLPIPVEIPGAHEMVRERRTLSDVIRQAIGVRV